jgi:poly(3-hydroxybutyrate) depolymerase
MYPLFPHNFNFLYYLIEAMRSEITPARYSIMTILEWLENQDHPLYDTSFGRTLRATLEMSERLTRDYKKPSFGIRECEVNGKVYKVEKQSLLTKAFCRLQHFVKVGFEKKQPKLLIVAPMAGHYSTLLRGTVQGILPHLDVYITDWANANQVPISAGRFDMDDFIDYVIEFIKFLGEDVHVMAVCQPTVPVLAAVSIMSIDRDPYIPKSMILMGGPVDASKNPTVVNKFATDKSLEWFENSVITPVPPNYPGHGRLVFPGFLQLIGFMNVDPMRHINAHIDMFQQLLTEDDVAAERQKKFYDEYFSIMDLPAEFYLQTIKEVFQDCSLARGKLISRGRKVIPAAITKCALLGIEGENDDIAGVGQTEAAINLCPNIPSSMRKYYLQPGVGHYGVFSGSKFKEFIVPIIADFVYTANN